MIRSLATAPQKHYRLFEVRKRSGGIRLISAPRTFLKVVQWWVLDTILENSSDLPFVYGFSRGRSFIDNAKAHQGCNHLLNVDVKDFFPSLSHSKVRDVFCALGYSYKVSNFMADLCTLDGALPQGAPTSPKISNMILAECDIHLRNLAQSHGATYTRYADDLTFSSYSRIPDSFVQRIEEHFLPLGLQLNKAKTKFMGTNQMKEVTGLVLARDGVALNRRYLNGTRGWFHSISQYPELFKDQLARVLGTMNLVQQVGGRGSDRILQQGRMAVLSLKAISPPRLEWGAD
ncbi:reverse transcriptase family protein [Sphingomonas jeddahensis]|uniref:RNA-directed DNA polymerase n=1 Tax=Sphingomonas jeddahensis TaxID=1915074 RepID=A0A1V2ETJ0_9SPHN|nr:reverse transcriptase family protein [Sphingomonas jeddahensis]ONF95863.1 Reverse transcriptase (RNA-dependent DNA polymerase) [Sphingomonas jeddahensis]